jgi:hypothetical protein
MIFADTIKQLFARQLQRAAEKSIKIQDIDKTKVDGVINDTQKFYDAVRGPACAGSQRTDRKN